MGLVCPPPPTLARKAGHSHERGAQLAAYDLRSGEIRVGRRQFTPRTRGFDETNLFHRNISPTVVLENETVSFHRTAGGPTTMTATGPAGQPPARRGRPRAGDPAGRPRRPRRRRLRPPDHGRRGHRGARPARPRSTVAGPPSQRWSSTPSAPRSSRAEVPDTGTLRGDLIATLLRPGRLRRPAAPRRPGSRASPPWSRDEEFAETYRRDFIAPKIAASRVIFDRARERGEIARRRRRPPARAGPAGHRPAPRLPPRRGGDADLIAPDHRPDHHSGRNLSASADSL